jgi:hypothetical protein
MLAQLFLGFWKIDVSTQGSLQQNGQRTGHCDMPRFGLLSASSLVNQKNVSLDFKSKTDRFALPWAELHRKAGVYLLHVRLLKP